MVALKLEYYYWDEVCHQGHYFATIAVAIGYEARNNYPSNKYWKIPCRQCERQKEARA